MKRQLYILLILFSFQLNGQIIVSGQLFDLTSKKKVELQNRNEMPRIWLSGKSKISGFSVDSTGEFRFDLSEIENMGDTLTFSIMSFNIDEMENDYADLEIKNIPKKILKDILSEIYLTKAYWIPSCGSDCFTVNPKRTFRNKIVKIKTQNFSYYMRRNPINMRKIELGAKYQTDLNKDIIK